MAKTLSKKAFIKKWKLDPWEVKFLEDVEEKGLYKSVPNLEEEKRKYQIIGQNTMRQLERERKEKSITLRIRQLDLDVLKQKAAESGMKYQTFLSLIIHQVGTGKIKITL
ncbi:MAG: hypothetical protein JNK26_05145 [Candidatus Doudnabacteria bacterium]|nr:hypothetical protein [Candidatus Doudnabacteria bacterium]